jgi:hypothetical protein
MSSEIVQGDIAEHRHADTPTRRYAHTPHAHTPHAHTPIRPHADTPIRRYPPICHPRSELLDAEEIQAKRGCRPLLMPIMRKDLIKILVHGGNQMQAIYAAKEEGFGQSSKRLDRPFDNIAIDRHPMPVSCGLVFEKLPDNRLELLSRPFAFPQAPMKYGHQFDPGQLRSHHLVFFIQVTLYGTSLGFRDIVLGQS